MPRSAGLGRLSYRGILALGIHASPLSSGAVSGYLISNKEIAHDEHVAGRSVA